MAIYRTKRKRGTSLVDVLMGISLLGTTVGSAAVGLQMVNERQVRTQERASLVNALSREIELRKASAQMGQLSSGVSTVTEIINRKSYTLTITVASTASTANPNVMEITANGTSTQSRTENLTLRTLAHNRPAYNVISVNYSPATTAYMTNSAMNDYFGYGIGVYLQRRWNSLKTATGSEALVDGNQVSVPMRVTVSPSTVSTSNDFGSINAGTFFLAMGEGAIVDSGNTGAITVDVTGVPYSRYNIVLYFGISVTDPIEPGWIEIDGITRVPFERLDYLTSSDKMNGMFNNNRNSMVVGPLSGGTHRFRILSPTRAPRFHGLQVAER